jgi:peptidoglycan/xylan/chitin deacetylase (PgdA/CDA1 family)
VVTFDDGLISFAEVAMPELVKRGIPSALFVVSRVLGVMPAWRRFSKKDDIPTERTLSASEILRLDDSVIVGSHTQTHQFLTELDDEAARTEIASSRTDLRALVGRDVTLFSFPYGEVNLRGVAYCRDAGYGRVFTSLRELAFSSPGEFVSGRVNVDPADWPLEFTLKVCGCYRWLAAALRGETRDAGNASRATIPTRG